MASQTFSIDNTTGGGAQVQLSAAISVGAGEKLRVRFTEFSGQATAALEITANSTATYVPVEAHDAYATLGVASGDSVKLQVNLRQDARSKVTGILETFT